jgi:predicted transcriptional regulator
MEVHLTPEKEALIRQLAARTGQDTAQLIQEAVDRLLDHDSWFRDEVAKGQAQAARGELIDHEEVVRRIEKRLQDKQSRS